MSLLGKGSFAANGDSSAIVVKADAEQDLQIGLSGTFGSGTVTVHVSDDNGVTYSPSVDSACTAADRFNFAVTDDCVVKLVLTGATSPSINWSISRRQPSQ